MLLLIPDFFNKAIKLQGMLFFLLVFPCTYALDIPVSDPQFKRCLQQLAEKNQWQSSQDFTQIICHNKKIKTIKGIEQFPNIKKLSLYKNQLADVNLVSLPKLEHINIAKNKLRTIKLNDLNSLRMLYLFDNLLTVLQLNHLPALEQMKANSNKLESVIFSHTIGLKKVYLFNNELETIDIKMLPALNYLDVRHNPMPDELYDFLDEQPGLTALHDGNSEDW